MPLTDPSTTKNPFYCSVPEALQPSMVVLAVVATIAVPQAVISGAFSLTSQAIQLDFALHVRIHYMPEVEIGRIYVLMANWMLLILMMSAVLAFKKSDNLVAVYGIAMTITTITTAVLAAVAMHSA